MRRIWLIGLMVLAGCGAASKVAPTGNPAAVQIGTNPVVLGDNPVQLGETVPDVTFELGGKTIKLSDYRGKTVVLNFWATWCGPCRLEMPDFEALYRQRSNLMIIGFNQRENEEQVRAFATDVGATFPLVLDRSGTIAASFNVTLGLPTTYFIDPKGIIQKVELRAMTRSQITKYLDELASGRQ